MEATTRIATTTGRPDQRLVAEAKTTASFRARPRFLAEVDAFARAQGKSRTTLIEDALLLYMRLNAALSSNGHRDGA